jgi:dolichyl-phosphate beta-glucosyltransferase
MHARSGERGQDTPSFSLVLPTYNAGAFLERTWQEVTHFLRQQGAGWEALFVCDGCTDGTTERLQQLVRGAAEPVRVLSYTPNRGKGHAVRAGLMAARGRWRIFTDVDLAYTFEDVLRVAGVLEDGGEVAIASRLHADSRLTLPPGVLGYAYRRHLQSFAFSTLVRCLLPVRQRDTQAGLKGVSAQVADMIVPRLTCDGFGFDCELLTACARMGVLVTEVPVCVRYEDAASTTNVRSIGRMIGDLWAIRKAWCRPVTRSQGSGIRSPDRRSAA